MEWVVREVGVWLVQPPCSPVLRGTRPGGQLQVRRQPVGLTGLVCAHAFHQAIPMRPWPVVSTYSHVNYRQTTKAMRVIAVGGLRSLRAMRMIASDSSHEVNLSTSSGAIRSRPHGYPREGHCRAKPTMVILGRAILRQSCGTHGMTQHWAATNGTPRRWRAIEVPGRRLPTEADAA